MRKTSTLALAIALAVATLIPGFAAAEANNESATYELHLEIPNVGRAPNGDLVEVTGGGVFSVHPKDVTAEGTFTHTDSEGNFIGSGTWEAIELLSFQPYGCGVLVSTDPDTELPPDFCGGRLMLRVLLTAGDQEFQGTLTVFCIIGPNPPNSHDEPDEEGVHLNVPGVIHFNKIVSGANLYVRTA